MLSEGRQCEARFVFALPLRDTELFDNLAGRRCLRVTSKRRENAWPSNSFALYNMHINLWGSIFCGEIPPNLLIPKEGEEGRGYRHDSQTCPNSGLIGIVELPW